MLTTSFPRFEQDLSGSFVAKLAHNLKSLNCTITVYAPSWPGAKRSQNVFGFTAEHVRYFWPRRFQRLAYGNGIPSNIKQSKIAVLNIPFFLLAYLIKLVFSCKKFDIIHAHWGVLGALAVWTKIIHKKPVVVMVRGTDFSTSNFFIKSLTNYSIKKADAIITNSPEYYASIKNIRPSSKPTYYIHNGIDIPDDEELGQLIEKHRKTTDTIGIINVGRFIAERKYDVLIKAFSQIHQRRPDTKLTLLGDGPCRGELERLAAELGVEQHINFTGLVPANEVPVNLVQNDIYVSATTVETHGNSVSEAAAYGLPIVTTNVGFPAELVQDGETGFVVEPNNVEQLAEAMDKLLSDEPFRKEAGQAMRARLFELNLSWEQCAQQTLGVYNNLL